jgi:hypothetical protein
MLARLIPIGLVACSALPILPLSIARDPAGGEACRRAAEAAASLHEESDKYDREVFFAVLEGLYADGVQNAVVDRVLEVDPQTKYPAHFVYACPICMPAYNAFATYRARPEFAGDKQHRNAFGSGLSSEQVQALTEGDLARRQRAILQLVQGWIERHLGSRRLNDDERARWRQAMEERRKKGMAMLEMYRAQGLGGSYAELKECAFCDAANGACGRR